MLGMCHADCLDGGRLQRLRQINARNFCSKKRAGARDYTKIDASLTLLGEDDKWWLALVGKNLTDELIYHFTSGTTTCARGAARGGTTSCLFTTVEETRAIGIRMQFNFR